MAGTCPARRATGTFSGEMTHAATWLRERSLATQVAALIAANVLLVACSQLSIHLPFTPVPITGQTFAVVMLGVVLGSRYGASVVAAYVAEGMMGMPVFADWTGGLAKLLSPTGGYILGFIAAAWVAGFLWERLRPRSWFVALGVALAGEATIFAFGLPWLAVYTGWSAVLVAGLLPFLPGMAIKSAALASACAPLLKKRSA